jgi:hypothetical protein
MSFVEIRIRNWEKFNPQRKDVKHHSWFRLNNSILEDPDFCDFSGDEFKVWIYILSQASKQMTAKIRVHFTHATRICGLKKSVLVEALKKLVKLNICVSFDTDTLRERYANGPPHNITEHNITEHNTYAQAEARAFDFEILYNQYPRKQGKSQGIKKLQSSIKSQEDFNKLKMAIEKYSEHCKTNATEKKFIKHFSSFVSEWRDWLDPDIGSSFTFKKRKGWLTEEDLL